MCFVKFIYIKLKNQLRIHTLFLFNHHKPFPFGMIERKRESVCQQDLFKNNRWREICLQDILKKKMSYVKKHISTLCR